MMQSCTATWATPYRHWGSFPMPAPSISDRYNSIRGYRAHGTRRAAWKTPRRNTPPPLPASEGLWKFIPIGERLNTISDWRFSSWGKWTRRWISFARLRLASDPALPEAAIAVIIPGSPASNNQAILNARRTWAERQLPARRITAHASRDVNRGQSGPCVSAMSLRFFRITTG